MQMNAEHVGINLRHSYPPSFLGEYGTAWICAKSYGIVRRHEKQQDAADEYWRQQKRDLGTNGRQQIQTTPRTASAPNEGSQSCEERRRRLSPPKKIRKINAALFRNYSTHGGPRRAGGPIGQTTWEEFTSHPRHMFHTSGACSTKTAIVLPLSSGISHKLSYRHISI